MASRISVAANINSVRFKEQGSNPSTPPSGFWNMFVKSDGVYMIDDAGTVFGPFVTDASGFTGVFQPLTRVAGAGNSSFTTTSRLTAQYIGKAAQSYSSALVHMYRVAHAASSVTWAEAAIATGPLTLGAASTLTVRGFADVSAEFNVTSAGILTKTFAVSGINPGDDMWVLLGRQGGSVTVTMRAWDSAAENEIASGLVMHSTTLRPSTMGVSALTLGTNNALQPHIFVQLT